MVEIRDATGTKRGAKVTANNRLETLSTSRSEVEAVSVEKEQSFTFAMSSSIWLKDGEESGIIYVKNTSTSPYVVESMFFKRGVPTAEATGSIAEAIVYRNPDTGTLITSASTGNNLVSNRNFGSTKSPTGDFYCALSGADGHTLDGGTVFFRTLLANATTVAEREGLILSPGSSIGVGFRPPVGNQGQFFSATILFFVPLD